MTEEAVLQPLGPRDFIGEALVEAAPVAAPVAVPPPRSSAGERGVTLLQLTSRSCRWPIGIPREPGFHFCGATVDTAPYCSVHRLVAYRAPPQR
jgi:GcrA cell cycle regulator